MSDDSETFPNNYYSAPARCRLCRFPFEQGDTVVADIGGKRSKPHTFAYLLALHPHRRRSAFVEYCWDCDDTPRDYFSSVAYHEECLDVWGPQPLSPDIRHGTGYTFTPSLIDDFRRRERTRNLVLDGLRKLFPEAALPPELWSIIASDDLVRMCAAYAACELLERRNTCSAELDLSRGIWAHYMYIDGVRYIERLTRAPGEAPCDGRPAARQLLRSSSASEATVVYVLEDYLGVRQLVFSTPDRDLSTLATDPVDARRSPDQNNKWWRTVRLRQGHRIRATSDGLKIRWVKAASEGDKSLEWPRRKWPRKKKDMIWRAPMASQQMLTTLVWTHKFRPHPEWNDLHMASISCNAPDVTGYTGFWYHGLVALHSHRHGEDLSLYLHYDKIYDGGGLWFHFPLAEGERLIQVFYRNADPYHHAGLIFWTNRGREVLLGPGLPDSLPDSEGGDMRYRHVCNLLADTPTRIHYNMSMHRVQRLAFEQTSPAWHPPIHAARPLQCAEFSRTDDYFVSTVHLDGVARITPSYKTHVRTGSAMMCGLLFEYDNERPRAAFGEFRLDNVGASVDVSTAEALYLGFLCDGKHAPHVTQISTSPRTTEHPMTWARLPLEGHAELRYSGAHHAVYHKGAAGPVKRIK